MGTSFASTRCHWGAIAHVFAWCSVWVLLAALGRAGAAEGRGVEAPAARSFNGVFLGLNVGTIHTIWGLCEYHSDVVNF